MSKDVPILMKADMVKALLDNRKTNTRRIPTPHNCLIDGRSVREWPEGEYRWDEAWWVASHDELHVQIGERVCMLTPKVQPGDVLWVKETFVRYQSVHYRRKPSNGMSFHEISDGEVAYRADGFDTVQDVADHLRLMSDDPLLEVIVEGEHWRPSIHMPKWACRIRRRVKSVRFERLGEISADDIDAEGIWHSSPEYRSEVCVWRDCVEALHRLRYKYFEKLWDSINGDKPGWAWADNRHVLVYEMEDE